MAWTGIIVLFGSLFCLGMVPAFLSDWVSAGEAVDSGEAGEEASDEAMSALFHAVVGVVVGIGFLAVGLDLLR